MGRTERRDFVLWLAAMLAALMWLCAPEPGGDMVEYLAATFALADHGSPDIRLADTERAQALVPQTRGVYALVAPGLRDPQAPLYPAFARGRDGRAYTIHFFGYPALAALPLKLLDTLGLPLLRAFQVANLAAVFALGLALFRFFGNAPRAVAGLALFMLCGGALYWTWTSPECVSAASLLAGLLLFCSGAPVTGALLAGLAAQQNPTILCFFAAAPVLAALSGTAPRTLVTPRYLIALAAGLAFAALPVLANLLLFGVPNIIAGRFSDVSLVGTVRLLSFFFDLNQGMVLAVPGVALALLLWGWGKPPARRRAALQLAVCAVLTLALALPTLAVLNWNSGAAGPMRYAFWAAMPLLFALLLRLRDLPRQPRGPLAAVALVQLLAMLHGASYSHLEFSPLARLALRWAPAHYHPEPEIFAERAGHHDDYIWPDKVYAYRRDGQTIKTLIHRDHPQPDRVLCGSGATLAPEQPVVESTRGWRYLDGTPRCRAGGQAQRYLGPDQFGDTLALTAGWSTVQHDAPDWDGVWSNGPQSRLRLPLAPGERAQSLLLLGRYFDGNTRTRVQVNGVDLGWRQLDRPEHIALPPLPGATALDIVLTHEAPLAPGGHDHRLLALFLREVTLRSPLP